MRPPTLTLKDLQSGSAPGRKKALPSGIFSLSGPFWIAEASHESQKYILAPFNNLLDTFVYRVTRRFSCLYLNAGKTQKRFYFLNFNLPASIKYKWRGRPEQELASSTSTTDGRVMAVQRRHFVLVGGDWEGRKNLNLFPSKGVSVIVSLWHCILKQSFYHLPKGRKDFRVCTWIKYF